MVLDHALNDTPHTGPNDKIEPLLRVFIITFNKEDTIPNPT
jgi:hypothetical protein